MKKYFSILIFFIFLNTPVFSQNIWNIWYQYGPFGGNVTDITISNNNQIALSANKTGSIYLYEWVDLLKNESVSAIEYHPSQNILFAVSNDSLKYTMDNGYHWANLFAPGKSINGISISSLLPAKIFLWSDSSIFYATDGDYNWQQFNPALGKIYEVYPLSGNDTLVLIGTETGLFLAALNGIVDTLLSAPVSNISLGSGMFGKIYASNAISNIIYSSDDNGISWDSSSVGLPQGLTHDLVLYDTNPATAFAATDDGVYKTVNGGEVWFKFSNMLAYTDSGVLKTLKTISLAVKGENIYAGTTEGIFRATVTNDDWQHFGPNNQSVKSIAKKSVYWDDNLFIGTSKGVQKSDAFEWTTSDLYSQAGPEIYKIYCNRYLGDSLVIAVEMKDNGASLFYRSIDNGKTFKPVFFTPDGTGKINAFYTREDSTNIIFALTDNDSNSYGMFVSLANGDSGTWQPVLSTFRKKFNGYEPPEKVDTLYFIIDDNQLFKSKDGGWSLEYISTLPGKTFHDILIAEAYPAYMFAAGTGVKKSTDFGYTWTDWGLDSIEIFALAYDWWSLIAASHNDGVFANYHLRGDWIDFNIGLPSKKVNDMVNFTHGYLHLATENNSVYMMYLIINAVKTDEMSVNDFKLEQNYPNPFNPATKIKFSLPSHSESEGQSVSLVTIKVYDLLGREITTLINNELSPGNYEVDFNGSNLASGVYFYRLESGSFSSTKKMMIIR